MKPLLLFVLITTAAMGQLLPFSFWASSGGATPAVSSSAFNVNGDTLTWTTSVPVSVGAGGSGGVTLSTNGSAPFNTVTASYSSGAGTSSIVFTLNRNVLASETVTVSYTQPGNGFEATTGGADLPSFSNAAITNSSTVAALDSITGTTNSNSGLGASAGNTYQGQLFTAAASKTVRMVVARMDKTGSPTFTLNGYIYNQSAGAPGSLVGTGSSNFSASGLGTTEGDALFVGLSASITSGTGYALVFKCTSSPNDFTNYVRWYQKSGTTNTWGNSTNGTTWTMQNDFEQNKFTLYGN